MSDKLSSILKARAFHAAQAVTLGALMLTGCPGENNQNEFECNLEEINDTCAAECAPAEDADCCVADPSCSYDAQTQSCGCATPGPFRAPEMPA